MDNRHRGIGLFVVQVLGPTSVGKSQLAIELAKEFAGEIISADSMQVYKEFNIGTAKTSPLQMQKIPHHGLDILDADEQYNAHLFLKKAWQWTKEIENRYRLPIVCGGTALYLRVMLLGVFPENTNQSVRADLKRRLMDEGLPALWQELNRIDPVYAKKIGVKDERRILRGLEILTNTGLPPSKAFTKSQTPFCRHKMIRIGLNMDRQELYKRIDMRVDTMINTGLLEETKMLLEKYPPHSPPFHGLGYKEMCGYLNGELALQEAIELIKQHSRNYAKRQLSWWRQEDDIIWFHPSQIVEVKDFLSGRLKE